MGHAYIITRGVKHQVDKFISELSAKYLPATIQTKEMDKPGLRYVQIGVRPIQLWEVVFPNEQRDIVLTTLFSYTGGDMKNSGFAEHQKRYQKFIWPLRRALSAKPIPKYKKDAFLPLDQAGVQRIAIGYRDDEINSAGAEQL